VFKSCSLDVTRDDEVLFNLTSKKSLEWRFGGIFSYRKTSLWECNMWESLTRDVSDFILLDEIYWKGDLVRLYLISEKKLMDIKCTLVKQLMQITRVFSSSLTNNGTITCSICKTKITYQKEVSKIIGVTVTSGIDLNWEKLKSHTVRHRNGSYWAKRMVKHWCASFETCSKNNLLKLIEASKRRATEAKKQSVMIPLQHHL